MSDQQEHTSSAERKTPRQMLALITLATDLPLPKEIRFRSDRISLDLVTIADGVAWCRYLGFNDETRLNPLDGYRYLTYGLGHWHGWGVSLHASEIADRQPETIADDQTAALTELAEGGEPE
jgi:hypothetical protein